MSVFHRRNYTLDLFTHQRYTGTGALVPVPKVNYDLGLSSLGHVTKNHYYYFVGRYKNVIESNKGRRFEIVQHN